MLRVELIGKLLTTAYNFTISFKPPSLTLIGSLLFVFLNKIAHFSTGFSILAEIFKSFFRNF